MNLCLVCQEPNQPDLQYCSHCGVELPNLPRSREGHLRRGVMLERRYEIGRVLGSGGFANAYLATDSRLGRACVVKEMLRPVSASAQEIRELERNFSREVQALVALNQPGHPNIPEIYDHFSAASGNYLVMKYIQGQNLQHMLSGSGALSWQEAVKIAIAVCDALLYMHSRQPPVLHRDIKPANILIDGSRRIWLVDFGLSKALPTRSHGKSGTTALGTAGYTPLEQWMEMSVPASDIYALGATLHHLLTGHDPRNAFPIQPDLPQIRQEHGNFLPIRHVNESLPEELEALLSRATESSPTRRPTAEQFKHSLEELLAPAKALPPFRFRHGKAVSKPKELVLLSRENWTEARDYLYNGPLERWFDTLGRHDLVGQLNNLKQKEPNPDIGLDKFLHSLVPNLSTPHVKLITQDSDLGRYDRFNKEVKMSTEVKVINYGPGCFYGTLELDQPWLRLESQQFELPLKSDFVLAPDESLELTLNVQSNYFQWNKSKRWHNKLNIRGNSLELSCEFSIYSPSDLRTFLPIGLVTLFLLIFSDHTISAYTTILLTSFIIIILDMRRK